MRGWRQVALGFLISALSLAILIGSFSVAMFESGVPIARAPTNTSTSSADMMATLVFLAPGSLTPNPYLAYTATATATYPPPTNCPIPDGWIQIIIVEDESMASIAERYHTTTQALLSANCFLVEVSNATPGWILYVPSQPTLTPTLITSPFVTVTSYPTSCIAPSSWIVYLVQPGDYLLKLAVAFRTTVDQIKSANCLVSDTIYVGQRLYVPNVPTSTPMLTATAIFTLTSTVIPATTTVPGASHTPTLPLPPTSTATYTLVPGVTQTPVPPTATYTTIPSSPTTTVQPTWTIPPTSTSTTTSSSSTIGEN